MPDEVDLGDVELSGCFEIVLRNSGNEPARLGVQGGPGVSVDRAEVDVGVGSTVVAGTAALTLGSPGEVRFIAPSNLCGGMPSVVRVVARDTSSPVRASPVVLDFGSPDCQQTIAPRVFRIQNRNAEPLTWKAVAVADSPYRVEPEAGTVAPGTDQEVAVVAVDIPSPPLGSNALGRVLSIETSQGLLAVEIRRGASGARLRWQATPDLGRRRIGTPSVHQVLLFNDGDRPATVLLRAEGAGLVTTPFAFTVPSGGSTAVPVEVARESFTADGALVPTVVSGSVCSAPTTLPLHAASFGRVSALRSYSYVTLALFDGGRVADINRYFQSGLSIWATARGATALHVGIGSRFGNNTVPCVAPNASSNLLCGYEPSGFETIANSAGALGVAGSTTPHFRTRSGTVCGEHNLDWFAERRRRLSREPKGCVTWSKRRR
ncbi:MAG: hypothetical protein IPG50_11685 [Myxococcales bacterium]|nr:hypothetical protein [Myxococcales bacterium]